VGGVKMSKSRGNVVLPDEVVHGVCGLDDCYEFRYANGNLTDWKAAGVWRHESGYFTSTRTKRQPVFLHEVGNPVPCLLRIKGVEQIQHPELLGYWQQLLNKYED
jgi:hypothetical protein